MKRIRKPPSALEKHARRGFRGYPAATVALYGPDDRHATKVAVGIIANEGEEPVAMERWLAEEGDIRQDTLILDQILAFIRSHGAHTVVMSGRIIGCPHEEGVDYPEGQPYCPKEGCRFWVGKNRWSGDKIH